MREPNRAKTAKSPPEPTRVSTARLDQEDIDEADKMKRISDLFKETLHMQETESQKKRKKSDFTTIRVEDESQVKKMGSTMTNLTFYSASRERKSNENPESL